MKKIDQFNKLIEEWRREIDSRKEFRYDPETDQIYEVKEEENEND